MKPTSELIEMLKERFGSNPAWWKEQYEAAVERVEDRTKNDDGNPYFYSPLDGTSGLPDRTLSDEFGGTETAADARERGFELLVVADLAEHGWPS